MITKFEKQMIAWMLTAMLCLSMVLSQGITTYADEPAQGSETSEEEANSENEDDSNELSDNKDKTDEIIQGDGDSEEGEEQLAAQPQTASKKQSKVTSGDFEYEELEDGNVEITKYTDTGAGGDVTVLEQLDGKNVVSIKAEVFQGNTDITQVTLPNTVTEIEAGSFAGCTNLQKVVLGEQLTSLSEGVFSGCSGLKEITLPESIVSIGKSAFLASGLEQIVIPESVTSIEEYAFYFCRSLSSVDVKNENAYIAESAFQGCNFSTFPIGDQVSKISMYAFADNKSLSEIVIPQSVTEMQYGAFRNCESLAKINFPDSLVKIGGFALDNTAWYNSQPDGMVYAGKVFYKYKGTLASGAQANINSGTVGIAGYAFDGQSNMKNVTIPDGVANIGDFAFHDCLSMSSITVPASVTEIGEKALGYKSSGARAAGSNSVKIPGFTIYGKAGSAAQRYANVHSFTFVNMDVTTHEKVSSNRGEDHIELRIIPEQTDNVYIIGSSKGAVIKCTGELKYFRSVYMDDVKVADVNYTLEEGSTILTFVTKYLDALSVGKHKVTMRYSYGSVDSDLTILARADVSNPVGDSPGINDTPGTVNGTPGIVGSTNIMANGAGTSGNAVAVRTGDDTETLFWVLTAMIAVGICVVLGSRKRLV